MRALYVLFFLILIVTSKLYAQEEGTSDYIVSLTGELKYGKITYAPGNKVSFKAEGERKVKFYYPKEIKGYFYKKVYHRSKFHPYLDRDVFMPSFRKGDDREAFTKLTQLDIKAEGKINLYFGSIQGITNTMYGSNQIQVLELDIKDNPVYVQDITVSRLADIVKSNTELYNKVLSYQGRLLLKDIERVVKEYNEWYILNQSES